jgi:uncharacterized integral membrane protein
MPYEYKRRRPSIIRNFWVYRRMIGSAILLGLMLWFVWVNGEKVTVHFPFGLGALTSTTGVVILMSALVGSVATILITGVIVAVRRIRHPQTSQDPPNPTEVAADRPPPDYAAKTAEGISNAHWSN